MKNKPKAILLLLLVVLSGFGREYLMVNINWVLKHLTEGAPNYAQNLFYPLANWKVSEINNLKWLLTILFTGYFFSLTYFLIRTIYPENKKYHKFTILSYIMLVTSSAIVFSVGYLFNLNNELYPTVRTLMGVAQSFIPLMVLYLLFKFIPKLK